MRTWLLKMSIFVRLSVCAMSEKPTWRALGKTVVSGEEKRAGQAQEAPPCHEAKQAPRGAKICS